MNNLIIQTTRINNIIPILSFLCIIGTTSCSSDNNVKTEIPVIRLSPENASTLKVSDFFDGYKIFEFKDSLFTDIDDFLELGDKRVAILNYTTIAGNSAPRKLAILIQQVIFFTKSVKTEEVPENIWV